MAKERYTRTNQKMYFAGLAIEQLRQAADTQQGSSLGRVQAEQENALFHLHGAVLALAQEILGYYRFQQADSWTLEQILEAVKQKQLVSPELGELMLLAENNDSNSWLFKLRKHYNLLSVPNDKEAPIASDADELNFLKLDQWRKELKILILHFRQSMIEF